MSRIVLTADRTLMSDYHDNMFLGFSASFPKKFMPGPIYYRMFAPSVPHEGGKAVYAPYAVRKMEAAVLGEGFPREEVVVAHPAHLGEFVGDDTLVLAVSTMDPLGLGPVTSTFTSLYQNPSHIPGKFREVLTDPAVARHKPKVIVGGSGAWQLAGPGESRKGIDCVVTGEGEITLPRLVRMIERGERLPVLVEGEVVPTEAMPCIVNASINGMVEVARGCGRGCRFCTPTLQKFRCRPLPEIVKEVRVNTRAGYDHVYLHAEDIWRYGAKGLRPNSERVLDLFRTIYALDGIKHVVPSHGALASVACEQGMFRELAEILDLSEKNLNGYQTGIETGSPSLVRRHMKAKAKPFSPEEWPEVVRQAFGTSVDSHWIPCATMIIGLPGETDDDVVKSIDLVDELRDIQSGIFPLFFVAMGLMSEERSFEKKDMSPLHWELVLRCWEHNFRYFPHFAKHAGIRNPFWDFVLQRLVIPLGRRRFNRYACEARSRIGADVERRLSEGKLSTKRDGGIIGPTEKEPRHDPAGEPRRGRP